MRYFILSLLALLCLGTLVHAADDARLVDDRDLSDAEFAAKYPLGAVHVHGLVNRPGRVGFTEGLTLMQAIERAGGRTRLASKKVRITRGDGEERQIIDVGIHIITKGEKDDIILKPGDIINVPELICP